MTQIPSLRPYLPYLLPALLLVPVPRAQAPAVATTARERVVRVLDIGALTRPLQPPADCLTGSHILMHPGEGPDPGHGPFPERATRELMTPDALMELIRSSNTTAWEQPGAMLRLRPPGHLLVVNQGPEVERTAALLEDLQASLGRRCVVDATLFSLESGADLPAVLTAAQFTEVERTLRAGTAPGARGSRLLWSGQGEGAAGEGLSLGISRVRQVVADYDVEVAQKATIADPKVGAVVEGICLRAVTQFTSDGRRAGIYLFGSVAWPAHIETFNPGTPGIGALDRPVLDQMQVQSSGMVENGGGLALHLGGRLDLGGAPVLLLVRARFDPQPEPRDKELRIWPVGALTNTNLLGRPQWFGMTALADGGLVPTATEDQGERGPQQPQQQQQPARPPAAPAAPDDAEIVDLVRSASPEDWEDAGRARLAVLAGALIARNQAGPLDRAGALLRILENDVVAAYTAEVTLLGIPDKHLPADGALLRGGASEGRDLAALAQGAVVLDRARLTTLVGREAWFLRGRESTHIADYEVEIAQEAAQANPIVHRSFAGVTGRIRVLPGGDRPMAEVEVVVTGNEISRRTLEEKKLGVLDLATLPRASFRGCRTFQGNNPVLLGEGPPVRIGDELFRTVVQISLIRN